MKLFSAAAALALFAASPAFAANTLIDFEHVSSFASINQYYNGGMDSDGHTGPSLGVSFNGDALGLTNSDPDPFFANAPSANGIMTAVGPDAAMNFATGFSNAFSFYYSSAASELNSVQVWSGLNGTGVSLASFDLSANSQAGGCTGASYCNFDMLSASFAGVAHSVTFGSTFAGFDNISISAVPEPTTALMLAMGLAGLALVRRRA